MPMLDVLTRGAILVAMYYGAFPVLVGKNAILDGCSTVDSKLDYDGIGWHSMVLHGTLWYFVIE